MLNPRILERYIKGAANHRRIQILTLLSEQPELSLEEIANILNVNYKTAGEHTRRLTIAGLLMKRHQAHEVRHALTTRGHQVLKFLRTLE